METANNYYVVLGVPYTESLDGIQKAYRRLAKECHPDHAGGKGAEKFHAIHEAYEVLSDINRRKAYDEALHARVQTIHVDPEPLLRPGGSRSRPEPLAKGPSEVRQARSHIWPGLIRHDVRQFARAAEFLLSPIRLSPDLTEDETAFIRLYVQQLLEKYGP